MSNLVLYVAVIVLLLGRFFAPAQVPRPSWLRLWHMCAVRVGSGAVLCICKGSTCHMLDWQLLVGV